MLTLLCLMPWRHAALGRVWVLVARFCVSIIFLITVWPVSPGLYCIVLYSTVQWPVWPRQPRPRYIHTGPQVRDKSRSGHLLSWYTIAAVLPISYAICVHFHQQILDASVIFSTFNTFHAFHTFFAESKSCFLSFICFCWSFERWNAISFHHQRRDKLVKYIRYSVAGDKMQYAVTSHII